MCTYATETLEALHSSAKGPHGWGPVGVVSVYYDHPVHAPAGHSLCVDLHAASGDPGSRVALELSVGTARELAAAILRTLDGAQAQGLLEQAGVV